MAESWKNCFEEELICPICLHVFEEPVQLQCKHNFCRGCLSEAWAKEAAGVRCPECNHAYPQKPTLEKNIKLTNIVEKFNSLNVEKTPSVLHCIFCRRGPPMPAQKVCLRCKAPCCQSHVQTHLQQPLPATGHLPSPAPGLAPGHLPSPAPGHLLVDTEEVRAWSCPQHDEYRLFHCEAEQTAVCQYCCFSRCSSSHGHTVCDVEVRRNEIRNMLMKQQERIEDRVQDIEEQLCRLESDKTQVEDAVCELKEQVRSQYRRMQLMLEEDLSETIQLLDRAHSRYRQENSQQALRLSERRQEADKLLSSVQMVLDRAEDINFMKNTKPVKLLSDRSQSCLGSGLPPHKVGHLNSKLLLSEVSKKEKNLHKLLEVPFSAPLLLLQTVPYPATSHAPSSSSSSGPEKRKHSNAFPEGSGGAHSFQDPSPSAKQPYSGSQGHQGPSSSSSEGSSQALNPSLGASSSVQHISVLGASSSGSSSAPHHTTPVFPPSHYPSGGPSQQAVLPEYAGRKILMCTMDNCYCSGVPPRTHPPYPRSGSFPWVTSQEYPPHPQLSSGASAMQGLSMRDWIDASQTHRHPDFYGLYGQSSAKHYVTS